MDRHPVTASYYCDGMSTLRVRVFFSHSNKDAEWVERVAAQAQAAGVDVYLAEHESGAGQLLSDKITAAIEGCDALIVLLSPNSLTSVFVQQEIGVAHHAGKLVIPILMEGVADADLGILTGLEYILLDPEQPQDALLRLSSTLTRLIDRQRDKLEKAQTAIADQLQAEVAAA